MAAVPDGSPNFALGQDGWTDPEDLQPNQFSKGINVTTKGGVLGPRWAFVTREQIFTEPDPIQVDRGYTRTIEDIWKSGKFQAAVPVKWGRDFYFLTVINGFIYQTLIDPIIPDKFTTTLLSEEIQLNSSSMRINWSFADTSVVFFDFPAAPVVVQQNDIFRCTQVDKQIPVSTLGVYSQFQLLVADGGVSYAASDMVGNKATPDAPISFEGLLTPNTTFFDQWLSLPVTDADMPITAMGTIQQPDTNTGIGPTFIATGKKVYYIDNTIPQEQWGQPGFSRVLLDNAGIAGQRGFVNVNSDVHFITPEAQVYSFTTARDQSKKWGNVPISVEVQNFLLNNGEQLNSNSVLGFFGNKIFISANGFRKLALTNNREPIMDYAFAGFVVLELDTLSTFQTTGNPVWAGVWTGMSPMEIFTLGNRCFVISKDSGINQLYEIDPEGTVDMIRGNKRQIRSVVETREYNWQDPYAWKQTRSISVQLQDLFGKVDLNLEVKPSHAPNWLQFEHWEHNAPVSNGMREKKAGAYAPQQFRELTFGGVDDVNVCNPVTEDLYNTYTSIQVRLTITADTWRLKTVRVDANPVVHEMTQDSAVCSSKQAVLIPLDCNRDWFVPEDSACQS